MRVFHCGSYINVEIGQEMTVARVGGGRSIFGEPAVLERTTKQHLVFKTASGKTVKTGIDNLHRVVGKAKEFGYFILLRKFEDVDGIIRSSVMF